MHRYCGPHKLLVHFLDNRQARRTAAWLFDRMAEGAAEAAEAARAGEGGGAKAADEIGELLGEVQRFVGRLSPLQRPLLDGLLEAATARLEDLGVRASGAEARGSKRRRCRGEGCGGAGSGAGSECPGSPATSGREDPVEQPALSGV